MNRFSRKLACFLLTLSAISLVGCSEKPNEIPPFDRSFNVIFVDNGEPYTVSDRVKTIKKGDDVSFDLQISDDYEFTSCDYPDYSYEIVGGKAKVTLHNVQFPTRFSLSVRMSKRELRYHIDGKTETLEINSDKLRINTKIGDGFEREGYSLIGWNTKEDGTGDHIGLGSKVAVGLKEQVDLYPEWIAWSDGNLFDYENDPSDRDGIRITGYRGEGIQTLVIPERIHGKKVNTLRKDSFVGVVGTTLVLPDTLETIESGAFRDSKFDELYFYDHLVQVYDSSFNFKFRTMHLNATRPPRFRAIENARFADSMERLVENKDKQKLVLFAGCSMSYGVNSADIQRAFKNKYVVCDMGLIGGTNTVMQIEMILPYLGKGDIFVHAPEAQSEYQLFDDLSADSKLFIMTEANFDLMSSIDFTTVEGVWAGYENYAKVREEREINTYEDHSPNYNDYGDNIRPRNNSPFGSTFGAEYTFSTDRLTDKAAKIRNATYQRIEDKGASVFVSFSPVNRDAFTEEEREAEEWNVFEKRTRECIDPAFPVISHAEQYIFDGYLFFDTDYHLTTSGAAERTSYLIADLRAQKI